MPSPNERTTKVTFDLPEALLSALRQKATEEERTISAELRLLVRRHVALDRTSYQAAPLTA
jgi:hypothetical protein